MHEYEISPLAARDIEQLSEWTVDKFGESTLRRYLALLKQAIHDLRLDPFRSGSAARPELGPEIKSLHLSVSRDRVPRSTGRVKSPRHCIYYRIQAGGSIEILRVLHEAMDIKRQLPKQRD